MNNKLPTNWNTVKLGEVCSLKNGYAFKSEDYQNNGVPLIRISDIFQGSIDLSESVKVQPKKEYERFTVEHGDILIAMSGATTGKFGLYQHKEKAYQNQRVGNFQILDTERLNKSFLLYLLYHLKRKIEEDAYGGAQPNISSKKIEELKIVLPPFEEQQLIVEIIEELLSKLDKGIESLKIALAQLKVYRQAVLKSAFEGKFTNGTNEWQMVKLGTIANVIDPQPSHRTPPVFQNGISYVGYKDIDLVNNQIDFEYARKVSPTVLTEHLKRYQLMEGDFVIGKIGTIGKPFRLPLPQDYTLSANVVLIQPKRVLAQFLFYFFQSSLVENQFLKEQRATTQAAFGIQKAKIMDIWLPNEEIQKLIVAEIESRLSVADNMEKSIKESLLKSEALRQSILKKAFEGKLVSGELTDVVAHLPKAEMPTLSDKKHKSPYQFPLSF